MLRYVNAGIRKYWEAPIPVYPRGLWELQAVIEGRCAPCFLNGSEMLSGRKLWVFAPETPHGWIGDPGHPCRIVVFHFDHMPDPIMMALRKEGWTEIELSSVEIDTLVQLQKELAIKPSKTGVLNYLRDERALIELALLIGAHLDLRDLTEREKRCRQIVERAMAWYSEHMHENRRLKDVADAVGISVAHLRRLFHSASFVSPIIAFKNKRLERACLLLSSTIMGVEEVALACGYGSASGFCRDFKKAFDCPPHEWRSHNKSEKTVI